VQSVLPKEKEAGEPRGKKKVSNKQPEILPQIQAHVVRRRKSSREAWRQSLRESKKVHPAIPRMAEWLEERKGVELMKLFMVIFLVVSAFMLSVGMVFVAQHVYTDHTSMHNNWQLLEAVRNAVIEKHPELLERK
jgi:hypothetical protein